MSYTDAPAVQKRIKNWLVNSQLNGFRLHFDDNVIDASGNGIFTNSGAGPYAPGRFNDGLTIHNGPFTDPLPSEVVISTASLKYDLFQSDFTIEGFAYFNGYGGAVSGRNRAIIQIRTASGSHDFTLETGAHSLSPLFDITAGGVSNTFAFTELAWIHLCAMYQKSLNTVRVYTNGTLQCSITGVSFNAAGARVVRFGNGAAGIDAFPGMLDEWRGIPNLQYAWGGFTPPSAPFSTP